jgi:predicted transcriptional regulator
MDLNTISQFIGQVGFPIAAFIYMAWDRATMQKELRQSVDNNTTVMNKVLEHIRKEDGM